MKKTFTGHNRVFLGISGAIIIIALILQIAGAGLNLGIDFTGGSILEYSVGESFDLDDVNTILASVGYGEVTPSKMEPSQASVMLQEQKAAKAEETVEEVAEEVEEAAEEVTETAEETVEEVAEEVEEAVEEAPAAVLLNPDKSGIAADARTDLQIRLPLIDETKGMDDVVLGAVNGTSTETCQLNFQTVTDKKLSNSFTGAYLYEFDMGGEFDTDEVQTAVAAALADYPIANVTVMAFNPEVEAAAATAEEAEEVAEETAEEATEETTEEATEETTEEAAEETTEEAAEETTEEAAEEAAEEPAAPATFARVLVKVNDTTSKVRTVLEKEMTAKYPNFCFVSIDHVSAIAGRDLISNAVKALAIAFICMLIYIAIRFDPMSGLSALFALCHDVLIMLAFMIFCRKWFQANSSFIAAILTIVGYSINNTIIIFDRIRENVKRPGFGNKDKMEIVEISVSSTLARTINTTVTTLLTLVCLYIFGVTAIKQFAFPLIVGMLAGTYSSVLVSGQVWAIWSNAIDKKKAAKKAA